MVSSKPAETNTQNSGEVELASRFSDEELTNVTSFGDAVALANTRGQITDAEEFGNGFTVLSKDEKATLIGVEMLLLDWHFNMGEIGEFVSVTAVTRDDRKVIFNDGSTGIYEQLKRITETRGGIVGNLYVRRGLRKSDYIAENGKPATTYYLSY